MQFSANIRGLLVDILGRDISWGRHLLARRLPPFRSMRPMEQMPRPKLPLRGHRLLVPWVSRGCQESRVPKAFQFSIGLDLLNKLCIKSLTLDGGSAMSRNTTSHCLTVSCGVKYSQWRFSGHAGQQTSQSMTYHPRLDPICPIQSSNLIAVDLPEECRSIAQTDSLLWASGELC